MRISRPRPTRRMRHSLNQSAKLNKKRKLTKFFEKILFILQKIFRYIKMSNIINYYTEEEIKALSSCELCPHRCKVDRLNNQRGYCNIDANINIALICNHKGEEPVLCGEKGICNVFFSHCNCQCIFCQNKSISNNSLPCKNQYSDVESVITKILEILQTSENIVGFVSPTPHIPMMNVIIRELHKREVYPRFVYNSSGYDNVEVLKKLENNINVYIPDFKYASENIARQFSKIKDYPTHCLNAIKEMYRQKGSTLITDEKELAESGLIIRHLILPNYVEESKKVLKTIAEEISMAVSISLMGQYFPPFKIEEYENLNRTLRKEEYEEVADYFYSLGLYKGWLQELSSVDSCVPDFENNRFLNQ